ncbi:hypothetical protein GQR60_19720 [Labilibaculum sp. A4]|uniref:hypothetical protein n=1 Tax=Labilibaculum TaxID=2060722 RepID=UPI000F61A069|nr:MULTISPECIES: hypothetical protein [Labilibaculum]MDM8161345.1 hypothetical protein [Labilibaculum sp. K2S]MDQ1772641.1 hypothetical protein [Labilibaculum euxinus]MWN78565.1 hypothetical protein [Labilibaculum euxinus]
MDNKTYRLDEANELLEEQFIKIIKDNNIELQNKDEAMSLFKEDSFDIYFENAKNKCSTNITKDENGKIHVKRVANRLVRKYNWVIHDDDLKFIDKSLSLLPFVSMIFIQQWAIPTQIIGVSILLINFFLNAKKKGAILGDDEFLTLLILRLLEKNQKLKKVSDEKILENINKKISEESKKSNKNIQEIKQWSSKELIEKLKKLQKVKHKDGKITSFVDTDNKGFWWSVDV